MMGQAPPPVIDITNQDNWEPFLDALIDDITAGAAPELLDTAMLMWRGLAAILVVWTGLRIAFSGDFRMWDVIRLVIALWIPWTMITFYDTPLPGTADLPVPAIFTSGGNWLQGLFINDIATDYLAAYTRVAGGLVDAGGLGAAPEAAPTGWSLFGLIGRLADLPEVALGMLRQGVANILLISIGLMLISLYAITYAQVIWAQIALAVLVLIGPIFIPFLLIEPLAFLFWGWCKSMLTFSLYGAVAAIIMRVFLGIGLGYLEALDAITATLNSLWILVSWTVTLIPLIVAGVLAAFSVGSFASMLVTGGGGGSGIMGMVGQAAGMIASHGASVGARAASGGLKG